TFGCQMNEYDSQKLAKVLEPGYTSVDTPEAADLIVINTCSVREKPEAKLFSMLGEMKQLKAHKPHLMVGVGGCVAQQEGRNIVDRSSVVDFVFGTHNISLVPALIESREKGAAPQVAVDYRDEWEELPLGFTGNERVSVFVSISRGCNKNCTYCIVPTTRGKEVSRATEEIKKEVRIAVHRGAREIVLLGQTVNSYGLDFTPRSSFVKLLQEISAIEGVERIRFTSPHPQEVRQDFIDLVCENPKICHHIHMPLQSGSDRILKAMNRNYRREKYLRIIEQMRARVPDMAVTTDIIVGFPGETEEDFNQTMEILNTVRFDNSYSFVFSPRPGTKAAEMEDPVPFERKLEQLKILQARQEVISAERLQSWQGRVVEVLLDGPSHIDKRKLQGRTSQNITLNLQTADETLVPGMLVPVLVSGAGRFTLKGDPLNAQPARAAF
ncbi:MAG: tRNA (N6-isopentenyl adenosine(37)-C2)-methylthiotransferase MiaB, partial [Deltaproteobacteria bacterium]|nr:tRNA (N6-isopentenyl adenosine(37)-C2)-methylthiotransferase MiaB [Deltaproteobacteria bacterium]